MEITQNDIKRFTIIGMLIILGLLVFFMMRPILLTTISGLVLAYIFAPVFRKINSKIKSRTFSATISTILLILVILIPLWFIIPILIQQIFQIFLYMQNLDIHTLLKSILPSVSDQYIGQISSTFSTFVSRFASNSLNYLLDSFLNLPTIILHLFLIGFVFFFTLRDGNKLSLFMSEISPLSKKQEFILTSQFKSITDSILFGQIITGLAQGIVAGIAFLIFGIPNAIVLTIVAIILGIIPLIGPAILWLPISVYLFSSGHTLAAALFFLYNLLITSTIDNFLRPYLVARRSDVSTVIVFIGMIAGFFVFGVIGLILGPLILSYFLIILKAYREKTLSSLFHDA